MAANVLLLHKPVPVIKNPQRVSIERKRFIFVTGGNISEEFDLGEGWLRTWFYIYVQKRKKGFSGSQILLLCIYVSRQLLCSSYMWQKCGGCGWGGGRGMKQCWKRPLFSFPLKAAFFSSPTHFFPEPVHFKSWPGPVCHVTCLPKGSFQINSSSPWDAYPPPPHPPSLKAIQRHHLLIGGASQGKRTLPNQDCIHCHDIVTFEHAAWQQSIEHTMYQNVLKTV